MFISLDGQIVSIVDSSFVHVLLKGELSFNLINIKLNIKNI